MAVSYTHLDVYKRQRILDTISMFRSLFCTVILADLEATHSSPNADNNDIYTDTQRDKMCIRDSSVPVWQKARRGCEAENEQVNGDNSGF